MKTIQNWKLASFEMHTYKLLFLPNHRIEDLIFRFCFITFALFKVARLLNRRAFQSIT